MIQALSLFASLATAIVLEAIPFLALGALISGLVEVFAPSDLIARRMPRTPAGQMLLGLGAGLVLPICECGSVPIVRRLLRKGVPGYAAIPYMLAAPVVNPVVLASTWTAFQDLGMVLDRALLVLLPATVLGAVLGRAAPWELLRPSLAPSMAAAVADHEPGCGCGAHGALGPGQGGRTVRVLATAAHEFLETSAYLILGACAAALFKVLTPAPVMELFSANLFLSVGAMMVLAVALSVCSEADAFVAASFASFPDAAKVAFVAIGPMLDLKLMALYLLVFRRRVAGVLMVVPPVMVYILAVALGLAQNLASQAPPGLP